ncbi:hypothetical protein QLQ15_17705 [Lysobacter sp. LF1]|uniref:Uncharacterized protein n=1 Tax=Lysobacter stagni TaxID=3045172 RepID=A0ABT6XKR1_9GAMM|nr:hypothetical protein [Lysobacter sp. LF1]MDI9240742.1 hypothetical protein [Lysobacter sp. LF1]
MKVVTTVTLHHREKPDDKDVEVLAPGEHDLPDSVAKSLIKQGHAKRVEVAKAQEAAKEKAQAGSVQVKQVGKGAPAK